MDIEYEIKFASVDLDDIRAKLTALGGQCESPMRLQKRYVFFLPDRSQGYARVRDEGDFVTMCVKKGMGEKLGDVFEAETRINSVEIGISILESLGCTQKSYQETRREVWHYKNVEIALDERPFLDPFIEIEGPDGESIEAAAVELGFDLKDALTGGVDVQYTAKYGVDVEEINDNTPLITFDAPNPFVK